MVEKEALGEQDHHALTMLELTQIAADMIVALGVTVEPLRKSGDPYDAVKSPQNDGSVISIFDFKSGGRRRYQVMRNGPGRNIKYFWNPKKPTDPTDQLVVAQRRNVGKVRKGFGGTDIMAVGYLLDQAGSGEQDPDALTAMGNKQPSL